MSLSGLDSAIYTAPFHVVLHNAIRERGLTLDRLRAHLAGRGISVGLSSLSAWQTGRSRPLQPASLPAVRALEDILGLPAQTLARLLTGTNARREAIVDIGPVADLLEMIPGAQNHDVEVISTQHKIDVDSDGRTTRVWTRRAIRVLRDGVDRYVERYYGDRDCDPELVSLQRLENCRVGKLLRHADAPALVYELMFDQALRAGDTWVFEAQLMHPPIGLSSEFAYGFRYPTEQYLLQVRFHPTALPTRANAFAQFNLSDQRHPIQRLILNKHNAVHLLASGVDSGVLGIEWNWD